MNVLEFKYDGHIPSYLQGKNQAYRSFSLARLWRGETERYVKNLRFSEKCNSCFEERTRLLKKFNTSYQQYRFHWHNYIQSKKEN